MGGVGESPNQRHRVSVKGSSSQSIQSGDANTPSPQQVAAYIAEMSLELMLMAEGANLALAAHLLAMAQAEAEHAADACQASSHRGLKRLASGSMAPSGRRRSRRRLTQEARTQAMLAKHEHTK